MNKTVTYLVKGILLFVGLLLLSSLVDIREDWGFFGHRRINRLAVFILPPEMAVFFKKHIEYITEHAVDPDKRRYATRHEAVRHYIDIDHWGAYPFPKVPRSWTAALIEYSNVYSIDIEGDTTELPLHQFLNLPEDYSVYPAKRTHAAEGEFDEKYFQFFRSNILPNYYEDHWSLSCDSLRWLLRGRIDDLDCQSAFAVDRFSEYGILPYHLQSMQRLLTKAFSNRDADRILRLSAELGHYISDGCVPLHTTENYNGQLSGQEGIHAFWESRIPELMADEEFDYFVGKAEYLEDTRSYFWDIILESHLLVDSVLQIERRLSRSFPADKQYCFDERLGVTIRTQCPAYAKAYAEAMQGMVESRMRRAIHAVGSLWYTAWVDAGQPDLAGRLEGSSPDIEVEELPPSPDSIGNNIGRLREHNGR